MLYFSLMQGKARECQNCIQVRELALLSIPVYCLDMGIYASETILFRIYSNDHGWVTNFLVFRRAAPSELLIYPVLFTWSQVSSSRASCWVSPGSSTSSRTSWKTVLSRISAPQPFSLVLWNTRWPAVKISSPTMQLLQRGSWWDECLILFGTPWPGVTTRTGLTCRESIQLFDV